MITFNMLGNHGRFGNQMFQYATLYSVAKEKNYKFGIPFKSKSENLYHNMSLNEAFDKLSAKDCSNYPVYRRFNESSFTYDPGIFGIPDDTDILGYFQTEKYFKKYRNDLVKEFTFNDQIIERSINKRSIITEPVISIHIRIGDYKYWRDKHPIMDLNYYKQALEELPKDLFIFAFSDEPQEANKLFENLNRKYTLIEPEDQFTDMCTMTLCDYHVIANSSYSWWGSWLSNSKKTIAPSRWFGSGNDMPKNWSDIYCKNWIII